MKKFILITAVFTTFAFSFACDNQQTANSNSSETPNVRKDVKPVADDEIAVIEMENPAAYGTIKIELYSNVAPQMVKRFKELAAEGVYDGVTFHRINPEVIQTGDPNSKDDDPGNDGMGGSDKPDVPAEFSDIPYDTGIVGAARGQEFDSANSQFFITRKRVPGFDNRYTIFGKVIEGMGNVSVIAGVPKQGERPTDDVRIKTIKIVPKQ